MERRSRGFTLLELAVVVALVGVLAALAGVAYQRALLRAKARATLAEMIQIRDALYALAADCNGLPVWGLATGDPGLSYAPSWAEGCWTGPYLRRWPDPPPLGGHYQYWGPARSWGRYVPTVTVHSISKAAHDELIAAIVRQLGPSALNMVGFDGKYGRGWVVDLVIGTQADVRQE